MSKNKIIEIVLELYDLYIEPEVLINELENRLKDAKDFNKDGLRQLKCLEQKTCPECNGHNLEFDESAYPFNDIFWHTADCLDCNCEFSINEMEDLKNIIKG